MIGGRGDRVATPRPRLDDLATAAEKAKRGIVDDTTATTALLDIPDAELLAAAGLTAEEARRIVQEAKAVAVRQVCTRSGSTKQPPKR
jgi:hypothetical protein